MKAADLDRIHTPKRKPRSRMGRKYAGSIVLVKIESRGK
jgi:hypothetical protein